MKALTIGLVLLTQLAMAKDPYKMTITVLSTKNIASEYETEASSARAVGTSSGSRSWRGHTVSRPSQLLVLMETCMT